MRTSRWLVPALMVLLCTSCATMRSAVNRRTPVRAARAAHLQVPYISQSELLCGGAAIAMIERWWGRRGVYAEQFANLVQRSEGGIRTTDMVQVMRSRGWITQAQSTTADVARQSVADSVPVIALIQVAAQRYHYVVIVGWSGDTVTYHDPAASPLVMVTVHTFQQRWAGAKQWAMFIRPAASTPAAPPTVAQSQPSQLRSIDSLPCRPYLDQAADAAAANQLAEAARILVATQRSCPNEPIVLRELAGVRFRHGAHAEAAQLADSYTRLAPADSLGWQLLASSRYLAGDVAGALLAWNVVGKPTVDLVIIDGSRRNRFRSLADGINIRPGTLLTPTGFALAQRRIADIPALGLTRVSYAPVSGGAAEVRAVVVERPLIDPLPQLLAVNASRAAVTRQITLGLNAPLALGELWTVHWRWRRADPRLAFRLDIPASFFAPTIVRFERSWETFRYSDAIPDDRRSASAVSIRGWVRPNLEVRSGTRFERWSGDREFVALFAGAAVHTAQDRASLLAEAEHAIPVGSNVSYQRLSSRLTWESPPDSWSNTWSMRVGGNWTSESTPRGLWPIAAGGLMRTIPLRAHPLIIDDLLPAARSGQLIAHGGVAGDRPLVTIDRLAFGGALFVDAARITKPGDGSGLTRMYVDGGAGLRASLVGVPWASVRVDLARGLATDKRWGVTAAFVQALPVRYFSRGQSP